MFVWLLSYLGSASVCAADVYLQDEQNLATALLSSEQWIEREKVDENCHVGACVTTVSDKGTIRNKISLYYTASNVEKDGLQALSIAKHALPKHHMNVRKSRIPEPFRDAFLSETRKLCSKWHGMLNSRFFFEDAAEEIQNLYDYLDFESEKNKVLILNLTAKLKILRTRLREKKNRVKKTSVSLEARNAWEMLVGFYISWSVFVMTNFIISIWQVCTRMKTLVSVYYSHLRELVKQRISKKIVQLLRAQLPVNTLRKAAEITCIICFDQEANMVFECGHLYCAQCSDMLWQTARTSCPQCRRIILSSPIKCHF